MNPAPAKPAAGDTTKIIAAGFPWIPDQQDGTFRNPILCADYSDPDVIRVGDDFYLVASSFNCVPGLPVLHSKDLVNWQIIVHVFQKYPAKEFDSPQHGCGVWAPTLRFQDGEFYVFFGDPDRGVFMSKAENPAGPWSRLHLVHAAKGWIDTCPFWDDDGQAQLVHAWAKSRAGKNSLLTICRMSADGKKLLDEGQLVFDGNAHHPTIEGPKLYKRNGWYYIFAPAGGVKDGWQTVLRSRNIFGPYEDRIVLAQGETAINGPHQGAWVETQTGESWFAHFQDRGAHGRVVHLQPMRWESDWPVIGQNQNGDGVGEPMLTCRKPNVGRNWPIAVPQTSDEFNTAELGFQWQWPANPRQDWFSLTARPGWLRLYPAVSNTGNLWTAPNLLLQKFPALEFTVTTKLDFTNLAVGGRSGLLVMGADYSYMAVQRTKAGCQLVRTNCHDVADGGCEIIEAEFMLVGEFAWLRVHVGRDALCDFSHSRDGEEFVRLGKPFTAREGKWIGAKVGLFSLAGGGTEKAGHTDFDWFRYA